jgi:UDP-GlcNAc:undecaprenyl-phosphate/decaprenyl-phosphate GlcNAc-1-phosphate transferase
MLVLLLSFLTAFTLTYFAIPPIIHIARTKHLFDVPVARSSHREQTPSLGGIAIFTGAIFAIVYWTPFGTTGKLQYILCALIILFLIGAKDDISPVSPTKKIVGQIMAAAILVIKSDIRLDSFYGLMGMHQALPEPVVLVLSIFTILVITNSFNLIDGINGLAGSIVCLIMITLGAWFFVVGQDQLATIAFATLGATTAFLKYNFTPAKIFMGDTGSLVLGLITAVLTIRFITTNADLPPLNPYRLTGGPVIAIGILIVPLYDTIRVFLTRAIRGGSPFIADRRHIHHLLIDGGKSHMEATATLVMVNMILISLVFFFQNKLNMHLLILLELGLISIFTLYLHERVKLLRRTE